MSVPRIVRAPTLAPRSSAAQDVSLSSQKILRSSKLDPRSRRLQVTPERLASASPRAPRIEQIRDALFPTDYGKPLDRSRYLLQLEEHQQISRLEQCSSVAEREARHERLVKGIWQRYHDISGHYRPNTPEVCIQATRLVLAYGVASNREVANFEAALPILEKTLLPINALPIQRRRRHVPMPTLEQSRYALRTFNAIISRLSALEEPVSLEGASYGMYLAAQGQSVTALAKYFKIVASFQEVPTYLAETMVCLRHWVRESTFAGWEGLRLEQGLASLLATDKEFSLYRFLWRMDEATRDHFLFLLGRLHGPQAVLRAWESFKESPEYATLLESGLDRLPFIVHNHVYHIMAAGEPKLAWELIASLDWPGDRFCRSTWNILLDHPEHINIWNEEVKDLVLKKYEHDLRRIEGTMGIRWMGGDDGKHVHVDEDGNEERIDPSDLES